VSERKMIFGILYKLKDRTSVLILLAQVPIWVLYFTHDQQEAYGW